MKTTNKTLLDIVRETQPNFIKEWQPYDTVSKKVERSIVNHFLNHTYVWQPTHDEKSKKYFTCYTFKQIDALLGLAYTSSSSYAGLWVCNSGYLWADATHRFIGFAVDTYGDVYGIADDMEENSIYIKL